MVQIEIFSHLKMNEVSSMLKIIKHLEVQDLKYLDNFSTEVFDRGSGKLGMLRDEFVLSITQIYLVDLKLCSEMVDRARGEIASRDRMLSELEANESELSSIRSDPIDESDDVHNLKKAIREQKEKLGDGGAISICLMGALDHYRDIIERIGELKTPFAITLGIDEKNPLLNLPLPSRRV